MLNLHAKTQDFGLMQTVSGILSTSIWADHENSSGSSVSLDPKENMQWEKKNNHNFKHPACS